MEQVEIHGETWPRETSVLNKTCFWRRIKVEWNINCWCFSLGCWYLKNTMECVLSYFWRQRKWESVCLWAFLIFFITSFRQSRIWVFCSENGKKTKTKQTKVHLNFERPGRNFRRHFMQQKCRLQKICLLWNWTFYPRLSSSSRASSTFFFLCNSAASSALGPELQTLKGQAILSRMCLAICCLPSYKSATSLSSHSGSLTGHLHSWSPPNLFTSSFPPDFPLWLDMPSVK